MRRVYAPFLLSIVFAAAPANAQWTPFTVGGAPYDVEVPDAGIVAVASSTGGHFYVGGNGVFSAGTEGGTNIVSAYLDAAGCRCTTTATGEVRCCGVLQPLIDTTVNYGLSRVRHNSRGARYLALTRTNGDPVFGYSPSPSTGPYSTPPGLCDAVVTTALDSIRIGDADYGVMAFAGGCGFAFAVNGTADTSPLGSTGLGAPNELELYESADAGISAFIGHAAGLDSVTFLDGGVRFTPPQPVAGIGDFPVVGISYAPGTGDAFGDGFGMAVVRAGAEDQIFGPIPDPSRPGQTWVNRTPSQVGLVGPLNRVSCLGGRLCGIIADSSATNRLLIYENLNEAQIHVPDGGVAEHETTLVLRADAGDADGDPVFVRWFPGDGGVPFELTPLTADGREVRVDLAPGTKICGQPAIHLPIRASASDGIAGHAGFFDTAVTIFHTVNPAAPLLGGGQRVQAGSGPITLTATTAAGECAALGGFTWTPTATVPAAFFNAPGLGTTATFTPPGFLCAPEATAEYSVTVSDGELTSAPATVQVTVEGWGAPNPAFPTGARAHQDAGTTVLYRADGGHPCSGTAGLPEPTTLWRLVDSTVAGATLIHQGAPVTSVTAPVIGLLAPECTSGSVTLGAVQRGSDTAALSAPEALLTVDVSTDLVEVQDATVSLTTNYEPSQFQVTGTVDSDLNCLSLRPAFAEVSVSRDGAPLGSPAVVNVPGSYVRPVEIGCGGGELEVTAQLVGADGGRSEPVTEQFTAPALATATGEIDGGVMRVACGTGARGVVSTRFLEGQCPLAEVRWTQQSGPALQAPSLVGENISLQTASTGLDGLIGERILLQVEADAGFGNVAITTHEVELIPDTTFVTLRHSTDAPVAEEGGVLGLRVEATNDSSCPISGVTLTQQLEGAEYLAGSARLDGVPVEASVVEGALTLTDVALDAHGTRVWTYSVRPRLLGNVAPHGQAFVKGHAISGSSGLPEPLPGCGCGSAPGTMAAAAALLLALGRRRRATSART